MTNPPLPSNSPASIGRCNSPADGLQHAPSPAGEGDGAALREKIARYICAHFICALDDCSCEPGLAAILHADFICTSLASVQAAPWPFEEWATKWHQTCETIVTMLGMPGSGSPQELLAQVQHYLVVQAPPKLADDQIMLVLRKVTRDQLYDMLTCKRWKDGIDIDSPTFAAQRLAEEFIALSRSSTGTAPVPAGHELCSSCGRLFKWGETCSRGGCPCGGDV